MATAPANPTQNKANSSITVTPAQVAAEVAALGGTAEQAYVAFALHSGVETGANAPVNELSGGVGPAAGLFQFEPGTWLGAGGGAYAPTAGDATWQEQVQVFINDTKGNRFGAWGPDLVANSGDPNDSNNSAYGYGGAPQLGSRVGNIIAAMPNGAAALANWNKPGLNQPFPDAGGVVNASPTPLAPGISGIGAGADTSGFGIPNPITDVDSFFKALGTGFGIGWRNILTIIGGVLLIGVGLLVMFHKDAGKVAQSAVVGAEAV